MLLLLFFGAEIGNLNEIPIETIHRIALEAEKTHLYTSNNNNNNTTSQTNEYLDFFAKLFKDAQVRELLAPFADPSNKFNYDKSTTSSSSSTAATGAEYNATTSQQDDIDIKVRTHQTNPLCYLIF